MTLIGPRRALLSRGLVPTTFFPDGAAFDGTNDYLTRGTGLTGAADNAKGILSVWLRILGGDGASRRILRSVASRVNIQRGSANLFNVNLADNAGTSSIAYASTATHITSATWLHLLVSWDTNFAAGSKLSSLYVDGVSERSAVTDAQAAFAVGYIDSNWGIGATTTGADKFNGEMAELYVAAGEYLDFSVAANRQKFRTAGGKAVDLGADGSRPTGNIPIMYHSVRDGDAATAFATNRGSGGNFVITGALDLVAGPNG